MLEVERPMTFRDVISVFSRGGGTILTNFLRVGAIYEERKKCKNTKKSIFFKFRGANAPPCPLK